MRGLPPKTLLTLGGPELLLTPLEAALVAIPLSHLFPRGGSSPESLVPWAAGLLALWLVLVLLRFRPLLGTQAAAVSDHDRYARVQSMPTLALLLRLAMYGAMSIVLVERLSRDRPLGVEAAMALLSICLLHPLCVGLVRWSLWHSLLRRALDREGLLPPPLTFQAVTLRGRLSEVALLLTVAAGALLLLLVNLFIPLSQAQLLSLQAYFSWPCLLLGCCWYFLIMPRQVAPLVTYLQRASQGESPPLEQLLATVERAHRLPFSLAGTKIAVFGTAGLLLVLVSESLLAFPLVQAAHLLVALLIVAVGAGVYEMIWSRVVLRPVVSHLLARPGVRERAMRATSIRVKMVVNLGGAVIFTVALALFWTLLPLQNPAGPAILAVLVLAASLGVVVLTAADVTRPLASLEQRAAEVVRGSLEREVEHDGEFDTSARISSAFEQMRQDLLRKLHTIEKLNEELEEKVRLRTAELQSTNSELVQAMEALKEAQTQLVRSEKMASVGQLVAGIAHEINNPINAVVNTMTPLAEAVEELTGSEPPDAGTRQDALDMLRVIRSGIERTQRIVGALRNYARADGEVPSTVDLPADISESLALLAHLLRDVAVEKQLASRAPLIAYRGQLNQALMNLLSNAAQAVQGQADARLVIRSQDRDDQIEIQVEDNGPGIAEEVLPRIFDPFFTTKEVGSGTGLGLSITQEIIHRHAGEIRVDSRPGKTLFTLLLPRTVSDPAPPP